MASINVNDITKFFKDLPQIAATQPDTVNYLVSQMGIGSNPDKIDPELLRYGNAAQNGSLPNGPSVNMLPPSQANKQNLDRGFNQYGIDIMNDIDYLENTDPAKMAQILEAIEEKDPGGVSGLKDLNVSLVNSYSTAMNIDPNAVIDEINKERNMYDSGADLLGGTGFEGIQSDPLKKAEYMKERASTPPKPMIVRDGVKVEDKSVSGQDLKSSLEESKKIFNAVDESQQNTINESNIRQDVDLENLSPEEKQAYMQQYLAGYEHEIMNLMPEDQYMAVATRALGIGAMDRPGVRQRVSGTFSSLMGRYVLQVLMSPDLPMETFLQQGVIQPFWKFADEGFQKTEAEYYNQDLVDNSWGRLVDSSRNIYSDEAMSDKDQRMAWYQTISRDRDLQEHAARAKAGIRGIGIYGGLREQYFQRLLRQYDYQMTFASPGEQVGLAAWLSQIKGSPWEIKGDPTQGDLGVQTQTTKSVTPDTSVTEKKVIDPSSVTDKTVLLQQGGDDGQTVTVDKDKDTTGDRDKGTVQEYYQKRQALDNKMDEIDQMSLGMMSSGMNIVSPNQGSQFAPMADMLTRRNLTPGSVQGQVFRTVEQQRQNLLGAGLPAPTIPVTMPQGMGFIPTVIGHPDDTNVPPRPPLPDWQGMLG